MTDAADFLPDRRALPDLRRAAAGWRGCDLHRDATQVVFGEGERDARIVLVEAADVRDLAREPVERGPWLLVPLGYCLVDAVT